MGITEKVKNALGSKSEGRKLAEEITDGKKEPQHIGKHTFATIQQEIYSLKNTNPMFRDKKWHKRYQTIRKAIENDLPRDPKIKRDYLNKLEDAKKRMEF